MQPELERLNDAWITAWLAKDVAAIEALMAPEYTYIAPNGQVLDRAGSVAARLGALLTDCTLRSRQLKRGRTLGMREP